MKLFRLTVLAAAALVLAACSQATSGGGTKPFTPSAPPALHSGATSLADFSTSTTTVQVTSGYNGLSGVSGTSGSNMLKFTYGASAAYGQTNIVLPLSGTDYSGYTTLSFDICLDSQSMASFLPVVRGGSSASNLNNNAWAGTQTDSIGSGSDQDALHNWVTVTIPISSFTAQTGWGGTPDASLSAAFTSEPYFDLAVIENAYGTFGHGYANNDDGKLKTGYIANICVY
jgi:hypothetical protein